MIVSFIRICQCGVKNVVIVEGMWLSNICKNQCPNIKVPKEVLNKTSTFSAVESRFYNNIEFTFLVLIYTQ